MAAALAPKFQAWPVKFYSNSFFLSFCLFGFSILFCSFFRCVVFSLTWMMTTIVLPFVLLILFESCGRPPTIIDSSRRNIPSCLKLDSYPCSFVPICSKRRKIPFISPQILFLKKIKKKKKKLKETFFLLLLILKLPRSHFHITYNYMDDNPPRQHTHTQMRERKRREST